MLDNILKILKTVCVASVLHFSKCMIIFPPKKWLQAHGILAKFSQYHDIRLIKRIRSEKIQYETI